MSTPTAQQIKEATRAARSNQLAPGACWWKACSRVDKTASIDLDRFACENQGCDHSIHLACLASVRVAFEAPDDFQRVVCSKRCYNALRKQACAVTTAAHGAKKRVMWHNDGPSTDVSSLSCLLDWLTSGDNYNRYRGGDQQNGQTKMTLAQEIVRAMAAAGIKTARTAKDVMNKISAIESSYRTAADWLSATGQGVQDEASLRAAVLARCSHYYDLKEVMEDRPSTRPLLLNTDPRARRDDTERDTSDEDDDERSSLESPGSGSSSKSSSAPTTIAPKSTKKPRTGGIPQDSFAELKKAQLAQDKDLRMLEFEFRERQVVLQEEEVSMRRQRIKDEARETDARVDEAAARASNLRQQAENWRQERKVSLLRERAKLLQEGVPKEEIELLLPLATYF